MGDLAGMPVIVGLKGQFVMSPSAAPWDHAGEPWLHVPSVAATLDHKTDTAVVHDHWLFSGQDPCLRVIEGSRGGPWPCFTDLPDRAVILSAGRPCILLCTPPGQTRIGLLNLDPQARQFVSRAGHKLAHALTHFGVDVGGRVCADFGSHVGGFVDCLLHHGAGRVYAIDTCYGTLAWKLRRDPRVVVLERTNAMHVELPECVDLITIDVAWTRQKHVLPRARSLLSGGGHIVTLIKPHYEAEAHQLEGGILKPGCEQAVLHNVLADITTAGLVVVGQTMSPIPGHGGNREHLALLKSANRSSV